jgi:hypothetical protein
LLVATAAGLLRAHAQSQSSMPLPAIDLPNNIKAPAAQTPAQQNPQPGAASGENADPNRPEVARQAADLLKMATDLKAAVDKSTKDELSLAVVRKAGELEQLAHRVRSGETARADTRPNPGP